MDWDKLRIFHVAAQAGSFTHAGDVLGLSQSAVSRQVNALEQDLKVPLFHRHARGLILTEQGEILFRTVKDVVHKLEDTRTRLADNRERPHGTLRVTTTVGIGTHWLTPRLGKFLELYPDIELNVILSDDELDLAMRAADVALRVRAPVQPDLIRRRLFTMHLHAYAAQSYLERHGEPTQFEELDAHRTLAFGAPAGHYLNSINMLQGLGREARNPRTASMVINNLTALRRAVEVGVGIAVLPDYIVRPDNPLIRILPDADMPQLECYLVYPEELKNLARIQVFRDFLVASAQRWDF